MGGSSIPPYQGGCGDCRVVTGREGGGTAITFWIPSALLGSAPSSTFVDSTRIFVFRTETLSSIIQDFTSCLVDGVTGSQGCLPACADTSVSLAFPSVCSHECSGRTHCLPLEGSSTWLSHCPQGLYQDPGSCSGSLVYAGMSHIPLRKRNFPCSGLHPPGMSHSQRQSLLSLHAGVHCQPREVGPRSLSGDAPSRGYDQHGRGILFPSLPGSRRSGTQLRNWCVLLRCQLDTFVMGQAFWHLAIP